MADVARVPEVAFRVLQRVPGTGLTTQGFLAHSSVATATNADILTFSVTDLSDDEERQAFYDEHGFKNSDRTMPKIWVHETNTISAAHIRMTSKLIGGYRDLEIYLRRLNSASPAH